VIEESKLEIVVQYESQPPKSLVHVEYEKLLENYLGAQGTLKLKTLRLIVGGGLS